MTALTPPPRRSHRPTAHGAAVGGLVATFVYQGLVPKLLKVNDRDVGLFRSVGLSQCQAQRAVQALGVVEATFGVVTLAASRRRWPFLIAVATMPGVVLGAARADRAMLTDAFNPVGEAVAVIALAAVALLSADD